MVIVIITDSLGLPRTFPEKVSLNETYIERLRDRFKEHKIVALSLGGGTLDMLQNQLFTYYLPLEPDMVIMHAGIVDCAPRALKTWELKVLNANGLLRTINKHLVKKNTVWLRKNRGITYTPPAQFRDLVQKCRTKLGEKAYWLGIIPPTDVYEQQVPGIRKNVTLYNEILFQVMENNFIGLDDMPSDAVMTDHHHINGKGHDAIYGRLSEIIEKITNKNLY